MTSLNSLEQTKSGTLYDMECNFLASIHYYRESVDTFCFIYSKDAVEKPGSAADPAAMPDSSSSPAAVLPERIFLMPEGKEYDYRAFHFRLSPDVLACRLQDGSVEKEYCLVKGVTDDIQEVRKNFRVYVSVRSSVYFDHDSKEVSVTIKDIGCGGLLFVCKKKYDPGDTLSIILFNSSREPLLVRARIRKLRPVRREGVYGYGCEFIDLPSNAEARILNFVFHTEVLQARSRES